MVEIHHVMATQKELNLFNLDSYLERVLQQASHILTVLILSPPNNPYSLKIDIPLSLMFPNL